LNERDKEMSIKRDAPWGQPQRADESERVLVHNDYLIGYDAIVVSRCG
jgi:hypothetical protein